MTQKDLRSNVVRRTDGTVRHVSSRLPPSIHETSITDREVDLLVQYNGVAVPTLVLVTRFEKRLVVRVLVLSAASRRETEVGQFDMTATVKKNIVRLDVTRAKSVVR